MNIKGNEFLTVTNGGLDIFKQYIKNPFRLNEYVVLEEQRFKIFWSVKYQNYVISVDIKSDNTWINVHRLNAIWFVKESFELSEDETYHKIDVEMNLGLLKPVSKPLLEFINL